MARTTTNTHVYGDTTQVIATAPLGTTAPTLPLPTALPAGWYDLGWIDDGGVTETQANQETKHYGWQGGAIVRTLRFQSEHNFEFQALEENAVTLGLLRRGSTAVTTPGTNEAQTVTITGVPTGGTFTLTYKGATTTNIAYNATNTAVQTALASLSTIGSGNVTVTGGPGPGTPYVATFVGTLAAQDVPVMTASAAGLTGGTTPAVAVTTTTPGVAVANSWGVGGVISMNLRQFSIDLVDGAIHKRYYIPNGEVSPTGSIVYQAKDLTVYSFHLECFPDASGNFFYDLNDNPALNSGLYA